MVGISDATLYAIVTLGAGVIGLLIKYSFKSKCTNVSCCFGMLQIERDVKREIEEQEIEAHTKHAESGDDAV